MTTVSVCLHPFTADDVFPCDEHEQPLPMDDISRVHAVKLVSEALGGEHVDSKDVHFVVYGCEDVSIASATIGDREVVFTC